MARTIMWRISSSPIRFAISRSAVTNYHNGKLWFRTSKPGLARIGDILFSTGNNPWAPESRVQRGSLHGFVRSHIGRVYAVTNDFIWLDNVPNSLSSVGKTNLAGQVCLKIPWPKFHQGTTADLIAGEKSIHNVSRPSAWSPGDRIRGRGIDEGTYITRISKNTFWLSTKVMRDGRRVEVYDAVLIPVVEGRVPQSGTAAKTGGQALNMANAIYILNLESDTNFYVTGLGAAAPGTDLVSIADQLGRHETLRLLSQTCSTWRRKIACSPVTLTKLRLYPLCGTGLR